MQQQQQQHTEHTELDELIGGKARQPSFSQQGRTERQSRFSVSVSQQSFSGQQPPKDGATTGLSQSAAKATVAPQGTNYHDIAAAEGTRESLASLLGTHEEPARSAGPAKRRVCGMVPWVCGLVVVVVLVVIAGAGAAVYITRSSSAGTNGAKNITQPVYGPTLGTGSGGNASIGTGTHHHVSTAYLFLYALCALSSCLVIFFFLQAAYSHVLVASHSTLPSLFGFGRLSILPSLSSVCQQPRHNTVYVPGHEELFELLFYAFSFGLPGILEQTIRTIYAQHAECAALSHRVFHIEPRSPQSRHD